MHEIGDHYKIGLIWRERVNEGVNYLYIVKIRGVWVLTSNKIRSMFLYNSKSASIYSLKLIRSFHLIV